MKIEPYFGLRSLIYSKNCLPEPATWKRFPTIGHPGGPGGRLGVFDLGFRVNRKMKSEKRREKAVKMKFSIFVIVHGSLC